MIISNFPRPTLIHGQLRVGIEAQIGDQAITVNILDWLSRTALELLGQGGLGWSFDKLDSPEPNSLAEYLKAFM